MTNEEKYETPEERDEAFRRFCRRKSDCNVCPIGRKLNSFRCTFAWLSLEAEEEKLLACPLCGYSNPCLTQYLQNDGEHWRVDCGACGVRISRATRESVITAWNRRAK